MKFPRRQSAGVTPPTGRRTALLNKFTATLHGTKAGIALVTAVGLVMAILAGLYRGVPVANLELHDGGVWVTNKSMNFIGHLNYPSRTLDMALTVSENFDVFQHGTTVTARDFTTSGAANIDVANKELRSTGVVPGTASISQGGETIAVIDPKSGKAWAMAAKDIGSFSTANKALVEKSPGINGAVDTNGVLHLITSDGKIQNWQSSDQVTWTKSDGGQLSHYNSGGQFALSTVGDQLVVLDQDTNTLLTPQGSDALPKGAPLVLQVSGPASKTALVASPTALLTVPLDGGSPATRAVNNTGTPVPPVYFNGCAYAAWMGTGAYLRDCPGDGDDVTRTVPKIASAKNMVFRVNRDVIVLNDVDSGLILLVDHNMDEVDNWQQMAAAQQQQQKNNDQSTTTTDDIAIATTSKTNHPPTANPDSYGVRAGQSNWLPVLANDEDPDGDILTASVAESPKLGAVQPITNGEALQIAVPSDATGGDSFTYSASDGRGGHAEAAVRLTVHPQTVNAAPKALRQSRVVISEGGSITYNVVPDWYDPDGDQVYLQVASAVAGTSVEYRPDGTITIRDLKTAGVGTRRIPLRLTDGREFAEGALVVDVKAAKNVPPVANSDHVVVPVGRTAIVQPLANDTDANGDSLQLSKVGNQSGISVTPDYLGNTLSVSASTPGTRYLTYAVSDGKAVTSGVIRVDVISPDAKGQPPAAVPDLALVRPNSTALIDLTANDTDPMGGVLVVSSVQVERTSGLSVQLLDHHIARVSAPAGLVGAGQFSYTESNGYGTSTALVKVLPLVARGTDQPPVAADDATTVRAGDIATTDVLLNDNSPADLPLTVDPKLTVQDGGGGVAFVSDNKVRFRAGPKAGTTRVTYTVRDSAGGFGSATVTYTVTPLDDTNDPPKPSPIIARTISGASVMIAIPTSGQDPDGDSVTLTGLTGPVPHLGAVKVKDGGLQYTAADNSSGTDVFGYTVSDRFGAVGTGLVYVGVAPAPTINQAPYAVADTMSARPSRALSIQVSANDIDPDGDQVEVVANSVKPTDDSTKTPVSLKNNRVELTTPATEGVLHYYYDITDGRGGTGRGILTINVSKTAPLLAPIARDDVVSQQDITGKQSVVSDVLVNDEDPDGATSALTLKSTDPGVTVTPDRKLSIPVTNDRQVIVYSITDPDKLTAQAVVIVPGAAKQPPVLIPGKTPVQVKAGELLTLTLADYVRVRSGRSPMITFAESVRAAVGANGAPLVKDAKTLVFTSTKDFSGLTSITFEVTDGTSASDASGQKATLSIPIQVIPNPKLVNKPPMLHPSEITVAAGDPAKTVDLAAMASDPDPTDQGKLRFTLGAVTAPFRASLSGTTLTISAPSDARAGTPGTATIQVSDGTNPPVSGAIPLQAVSSTRPLMSIAPIFISDATAGKPSVVDVTGSVTNPFAAEGKAVHMVGRQSVTGAGTATASGLSLTITPNANTNGQLVVQYRLGDATNDPNREQSGTVTLTVRDKPAPPTNVVAVSTISHTADVTWASGANNGSPITGFTVKWSGANGSSGQSTVGQVTHLTVPNLTNNVFYTFTVLATNAKGDSLPSTPSNPVRPDTKPNQVGRPTGVFGDKQITVSWPTGTTDGAPIAYYSVTISPATGGIATKDNIRGTSVVWTGLTNGTPYTFTVIATSVNNLPSDPSPASAQVIPVGAPFQPSAPSVVKDPASNLPPAVTVSWSPPNGNGDNNMTYEMRESGSSNVLYSGANTSAHATIAMTSSGVTFEVRATNKSNLWSPWSPVSNAIRPIKLPGAVQGFSLTPTGNNNEVKFSFSPGALNGAQPSEMSYRWSSSTGGSGAVSPGDVVTSSAFPNGQNVTVTLTPVAQVNGETATGPGSSATVNAYGPPTAPSVDAIQGVNEVTLTWNGSGSANGRPITQVELNTTDGGSMEGVTGSKNEGNGRAQTKCISARAIDSVGTRGAWSQTKCNSTWQTPEYWFTQTDKVLPTPKGASGTWYAARLDLRYFNPNSTVYCWAGGVNAPDWSGYFVVDGAGNYSGSSKYNGFYASGVSGNIATHMGTCTQR